MVTTKHFCEWPDCNKDYDTFEKAEECESQGFIGPSIKPGLIIKHNNRYEVFMGCTHKGHDRVNCTHSFDLSPDGEGWMPRVIMQESIGSKTLELEVKAGKFSIIEIDEFKRIKEPVGTHFKRFLKGNELYNEHTYFQK